jgi:hypothetical protein
VVLFSDNVALGDFAAARLMGFDPERIPLIKNAFGHNEFPICEGDTKNTAAVWNGETLVLCNLPPVLNRGFVAPSGWRGWIERAHDHHRKSARAAIPL